jgi:hypothetical protein
LDLLLFYRRAHREEAAQRAQKRTTRKFLDPSLSSSCTVARITHHKGIKLAGMVGYWLTALGDGYSVKLLTSIPTEIYRDSIVFLRTALNPKFQIASHFMYLPFTSL